MTTATPTEPHDKPREQHPGDHRRWLPDSPYAALGPWALLLALLGVDVALLKPMVNAATNESHEILTWILTGGIGVAYAATMALAAELLMKYVDRKKWPWLLGAAVFATAWTMAVTFSFFFRLEYRDPAESGSSGALFAAALLTILIVLTGLIALGLAILTHDELQRQRRKKARRVQRLRYRLRITKRYAEWHARGAQDRQGEIDSIAACTVEMRKEIPSIADSLRQGVRLRMAIALGNPASTTPLMHGPISIRTVETNDD